METNEKLLKFRRMSSTSLLRLLQVNPRSEEKDLILKVLGQRNVEVPEESPTEEKRPSKEQLDNLDILITKVCECDNDSLKHKVGEILEGVEECSDLSVSQIKKIESLCKEGLTETRGSGVRKVSVPEFQSGDSKLQSLILKLQEGILTKKAFIGTCIELGIERKTLLSFLPKGLIDPTYIYDLYKLFQK